MDKILNLRNLAGIESFSSRFSRLRDLYILSHVDTSGRKHDNEPDSDVMPGMHIPLRLDGMLLLLIQQGEIGLDVNTSSYHIGAGDILVVRPGTLVMFTDIAADTELTMLFISSTLLNSINIDINSLEFRTLASRPKSVLRLSHPEAEVLRKYFDLLDLNAAYRTHSVFSTRIARSLISAVAYEMIRFSLARDINESQQENISDAQTRSHSYVYRFLQLLQIHFTHERNLDFYARELCITPKYLSMITKEVTGFSASEWINRVITLEAKNMLRFSEKNIQEIAYALNFPSQSAFGKFFKRTTGQSPSQYLKN